MSVVGFQYVGHGMFGFEQAPTVAQTYSVQVISGNASFFTASCTLTNCSAPSSGPAQWSLIRLLTHLIQTLQLNARSSAPHIVQTTAHPALTPQPTGRYTLNATVDITPINPAVVNNLSAATSFEHGSLETAVAGAQVSFVVHLLDAYENRWWLVQIAPVVDVSRFRCRPTYTKSQNSHRKAHHTLNEGVMYKQSTRLFTAGLTPRCRVYPPHTGHSRNALRQINRTLSSSGEFFFLVFFQFFVVLLNSCELYLNSCELYLNSCELM